VLADKQLIEPERPSVAEEDAFRFHHVLLRDVAYDSLPKVERAVLHERFAAWLDERLPERAAEFDEILGYHLEMAYRYESELGAAGERGRWLAERAAQRLAAAGLRARARGDMPASANLLSRALDLLPPEDAARSELLPALQEALLESGALHATRLSPSSIRCFWSRPLGHRWALIERRGAFVLRCSGCGREKPAGVARGTEWTVPEGGPFRPGSGAE
jgi:predicted ATPase